MDDATPSYVLAFDTANEVIAIGLGRLDAAARSIELVASVEVEARRASNTQLVPRIDELCARAGVAREKIACVCVGRGPGSFTGVRIALATAKGIASALEIGLVGVSSLDAVAWGAWKAAERGELLVVADAMRREVYPVEYRLDDSGAARLTADRVIKAEAFAEELGATGSSDRSMADDGDAGDSRHGGNAGDPSRRGRPWSALPTEADVHPDRLITGDGLRKYAEFFESAGALLPEALWTPTGAGLLLALQAAWQAGECDPFDAERHDPGLLLPVYTRLSDAEENERKRLGLAESVNTATTGVADELAGRHLQLRPMAAADAEAMAALERTCFVGAGHEPWSASMFLAELDPEAPAARSWWVAHDNGELIGFAGGMVVDKDVEILDVAVAPEHRREGIARKLLAHVSYDAQMLGCTSASLEVEAGNASAIALYESLGFVEVGRRRGYYGAGVDALVMGASLPLVLPVDAASPEPTAASVREWPLPAPERTDDEAAELARRQLVLAIESSCDETAVAIIDAAGNLLANQVSTQIDFHARFGGVVPEIASRKHVEVIVGIVDAALGEAAVSLGLKGGAIAPFELAAVGVTQGPGLVGALVVGVAFAKGFAFAADKPLICVNHLEGHLFANKLTTPDLEPPFIFTLVSGGHTMLVHVRAWGDYEVMGETLDDAVGEAFDKVAKALGLGYPGGPVISRLAEDGNPKAIDFPRALNSKGDYRFSLSGLKTAVTLYIEQETAAGRTIHLPDLAASFEAAVFDVQYKKAKNALRETGAREYCIGGGVAANPHLRKMMIEKLGRQGIRVTVPPQNACTDNAAMIAVVAREKFLHGEYSDFTVDADPNMTL